MERRDPPSTMSSGPGDDSTRLLDESFAMHSFPSPADTLVDPRFSPPPQARQRPGYFRVSSSPPEDDEAGDLGGGDGVHTSGAAAATESPHGLGIQTSGIALRTQPHRRETSDSIHPAMDSFETVLNEGNSDGRRTPASYSSSRPLNLSFPGGHKSKKSGAYSIAAPSVRSTKSYADTFYPQHCPSRRQIYISRGHYLSVILLTLSIFSTFFSGFYLAVAIRRPHYGNIISDHGRMTYNTASTLIALFAKLTELSFVTVFVAFIGQVISRRAFMKKQGRGITLAELSMRSWVMQPGTILTHLEGVRYAVVTVMGVMALVAAIVAALYTTASDALVSPTLAFTKFETKPLQGRVKQKFADIEYIASNCQTPIRNDTEYGSTTCTAIQYPAAYKNLETYLSIWTDYSKSPERSSELRNRPNGVGLFNDNITIAAPWIEIANMSEAAAIHGRLINNVSLAFPHAGVIHATSDPINGILQPRQQDGLGAYDLQASVPSPVLHVLCVNISYDELTPMIYSAWPGAENPLNTSDWPHQVPLWAPNQWLNRTAVDDIFELGPQHGNRRPPVFPKYPMDYNTLLNATGNYNLMDTIYVLAKGGPEVGGDFSMCSLRASQTPFCSTQYSARSSGSHIEAHCEDPHNDYQYIRRNASEPSGNATISVDWTQVGWGWGTALSLGQGLSDADASISRMLSQFIPTSKDALNRDLPSLAEALAVLGGSTLLTSTLDAPYREYFEYDSLPPEGVYQTFDAALRSQTYASGAVTGSQNGFYVILLLIFLANLLVLIWFVLHRGLVTDFSDPANMFSLTINSPPSHAFAGSCGGGPEKEQYATQFFVNMEGEHVFLEPRDNAPSPNPNAKNLTTPTGDVELTASPITRAYSRLSKRKSFF